MVDRQVVERRCLNCDKVLLPEHISVYCNRKCNRQHYGKQHIDKFERIENIHKSGTVGALGELIVSANLLSKGWHVFRSVSPSCPCDIIAMCGTLLLRIEVTAARRNNKTGAIAYDKHDRTKHDVLALWFCDLTVKYLTIIGEPYDMSLPSTNKS